MKPLLSWTAAAVAAAACLALPSVATADILSGPTPQLPQYGPTVFGGDDAGAQITLSFNFTFFGQTYKTLNVSSNGFVTFVSPGDMNLGVEDFKPAAASFLEGPPRIAAQWFDWVSYVYLDTSQAGRVAISWMGEEYGDTALHLSQLELFSDGRITLAYSGVTPNGPVLTGISGGGGVADPGSTNFAGANFRSEAPAIYSLSAAGAFDSRYGVNFAPDYFNGGYIVTAGKATLADPPPLPQWPEEPGGGPPTTAVPEPTSWALLILGFGATGGMLRKRKRLAA